MIATKTMYDFLVKFMCNSLNLITIMCETEKEYNLLASNDCDYRNLKEVLLQIKNPCPEGVDKEEHLTKLLEEL